MGIAYSRPSTLAQAVEELGEEGVLPLAGGVSLVLLMNRGLINPRKLVALDGIAEMHGVRVSTGLLDLGAMCTHDQLARDPALATKVPGAVDMFSRIGNIRVRTSGTVGGSLVNADPTHDPAVMLTALGAHVVVVGPAGKRMIPVEELANGPFSPVLKHNEVLTRVRIPLVSETVACSYVKFRSGSAADYPTVSVAALVDIEIEGGGVRIADARLAVGAVGPTPMALHEATTLLVGNSLSDEDVLWEVGERVRESVTPVSDQGGSADYKRHMAGVVAVEALRACFDAGSRVRPVTAQERWRVSG